MNKTLIQHTVQDNVVTIHWTNELGDVLLSAQCWPKHGWHAGAYKAAESILSDVVGKLDIKKPVKVHGHSFGGAVGQVLTMLLMAQGYDVKAELTGTYPTTIRRYKIPCTVTIWRDDIVFKLGRILFWWFRFPCRVKRIGHRRWWRLSWKDHVTDPNARGAV